MNFLDILSPIEDYLNSFFNGIVNNIFEFIFHPQFTGILLFLKVVFVIASAILAINIYFLLKTSTWKDWRFRNIFSEFLHYKTLQAADISKKWKRVENLLESKKENNCKIAVLEAYDLLKKALEMDGYTGSTMEEQLAKVDPADIPDPEPVLKAVQFRNSIVKEPEKKVNYQEAEKAVKSFEKAFESLQRY